MRVLEKKETTFKEICDMLNNEEKRFLNWEWDNYSTLDILTRIKNRKNTFLTSN
jgi:hypothetical protein